MIKFDYIRHIIYVNTVENNFDSSEELISKISYDTKILNKNGESVYDMAKNFGILTLEGAIIYFYRQTLLNNLNEEDSLEYIRYNLKEYISKLNITNKGNIFSDSLEENFSIETIESESDSDEVSFGLVQNKDDLFNTYFSKNNFYLVQLDKDLFNYWKNDLKINKLDNEILNFLVNESDLNPIFTINSNLDILHPNDEFNKKIDEYINTKLYYNEKGKNSPGVDKIIDFYNKYFNSNLFVEYEDIIIKLLHSGVFNFFEWFQMTFLGLTSDEYYISIYKIESDILYYAINDRFFIEEHDINDNRFIDLPIKVNYNLKFIVKVLDYFMLCDKVSYLYFYNKIKRSNRPFKSEFIDYYIEHSKYKNEINEILMFKKLKAL